MPRSYVCYGQVIHRMSDGEPVASTEHRPGMQDREAPGLAARMTSLLNACASIPGDPEEAIREARKVLADLEYALGQGLGTKDESLSDDAGVRDLHDDVRRALAALGEG